MPEETQTRDAWAELHKQAQAAAQALLQSSGGELAAKKLAASTNPVDALTAAYYRLEAIKAAKAS